LPPARQDGTVFQKDLGPKTGGLAGAMTKFDPDDSWQAVQGAGEPAQASH
jgi:hypothetical protein